MAHGSTVEHWLAHQRRRFDSCGANAAGSLPDDLSVAEHHRENDNAGRKTGTAHGAQLNGRAVAL